MNRCLYACAALAFAAGSANAAIFGFGGTSSDETWIYTGNGGAISGATGAQPIVLTVGDDFGPAQPLLASVTFSANYTLTFVGSIPLPGGAVSYAYAASGQFVFTDVVTNTTLLTTNFSNALFTARGSANAWSTTGSLQVDDSSGATVSMVWGGANLPLYGLSPGTLDGSPRDFSFDLSTINTSGSIPYNGTGPGVALNPNTHLPSTTWFADASYTADARSIPTPGSLALLGLGGLALRRRRR